MAALLVNKPSFVEKGSLSFLILDTPSNETLPEYIDVFKQYDCSHVICVCDCTYNVSRLEAENISVKVWPFVDGGTPPQDIVDNWLDLVGSADHKCIAVHCVAGLGRAPVLVAIALVEYGKMQPLDAIGFVRERRRGAINAVQMKYLQQYRRRATKKCTVM